MENNQLFDECRALKQACESKSYKFLSEVMTKNYTFSRLEKLINSLTLQQRDKVIEICMEGFDFHNHNELFRAAKEKFYITFTGDIIRIKSSGSMIVRLRIKPEKEKEFLQCQLEFLNKDYFEEIPVKTIEILPEPDLKDSVFTSKTKKVSRLIVASHLTIAYQLKRSVNAIINFWKKL